MGDTYKAFEEASETEIEKEHNDKGQLHGQPALRFFWPNGQLKKAVYYVNGKMHREDGPTYVFYNRQGEKTREEYALHGKVLSEEEFIQQI